MENQIKIRNTIAPFLFCLIFHINALSQNCTPALVSPENGAELDNGCDIVEEQEDWFFDWEDCEGATKYHLYVKHNDSKYPAINADSLLVSEMSVTIFGYILDRNRFDWRWKVRALINDEWNEWSEERSFDVEPLNTDCQGICVVRLTEPENGREVDNGCQDETEIMSWLFDWTTCENAVRYHLRVENILHDLLLIDNDSIESAIFEYNVYDVIPANYQFGWQWKVRAFLNDNWGPWSVESNFWVEAPNTDCPVTGIEDAVDLFYTIYPNPAAVGLSISIANDADIRSVVISDLNGSKINSYNYSRWSSEKGAVSITLYGIRPGIYTVQIATDKDILKQKLIVN